MQIFGLILHSWGFLGWCSLAFVVFSLAFYLGITLCVMHARKKYIADLGTLDALFMIGGMLKANMSRAITVMNTTQTIKFVLVFILSGFIWVPLGYYYRDHVLVGNIFTRKDLDVKEVFAAGNAKLIERKSGDIVYTNPCPESPTKFVPGMHVTEIRYAQMAGCKLVKYFDYDMRPDGRAQIGEIADAR